jgi:hypothetical protein
VLVRAYVHSGFLVELVTGETQSATLFQQVKGSKGPWSVAVGFAIVGGDSSGVESVRIDHVAQLGGQTQER